MDQDSLTKVFVGLVKKYQDRLGSNEAEAKERADAQIEAFMVGEQEIGFTSFVQSLRSTNTEVDEATQTSLKELATALNLLDDPSGKGKYW